ncbi:MAG TPA: HEAT repeat domain-containing protein [Gemmataceae bacterium]|nr:HEAT repeat domain-containing protein [Gemmataceae bacterium]
MRRILQWSFAVVAIGLLSSGVAAEEATPAVEEWQVRGILAALKDGYPQVRVLAAAELEDLLKADLPGGPPREWKGQSASLVNEARDDLRELLKESDAGARAQAARALTRLYERGKDTAALRELLRDPNSPAGWYAAWQAAQALPRIHERAKDAAALRALLDEPDRNVRWYASQCLARLYQGTRDAPALRDLLKHPNPDARREAAAALARLGEEDGTAALRDILKEKDTTADARRKAAEALARLGEKDGVPVLRDSLKDPRPIPRQEAAEALAELSERAKDPGALRDLLKDDSPEAREKAAEALARLYAEARNAPALRDLLKDANPDLRREAAAALARLYETATDVTALRDLQQSPDPDAYREASWALVRLYQASKDTASLRMVLEGPDPSAAREAAWALGRLGEKEVVPELRERLKDPLAPARRETADVLTRLGDTDPIVVLRIPYEDLSYLYWARWQSHYWGGRKPEVARVLCAYLGHPKEDPTPPVSDAPGRSRQENALADLRVLREEAWEKTDSPWLKEDVAKWWSWIITEEVTGWKTAEEVGELRKVRDSLREGPVGRRYVAGIDRVLEPFEISPSPLVRTWIVAGFLNLIALALFVAGPRLGGPGRWLPLSVSGLAALAVSLADVARWEPRAHTIPWLLGLVLLAEVALLLGAAVVSPAVLRQVAKVEPLRRVALRLALRRPQNRRRFLDDYAAATRGRLGDARDRAAFEEYVPLPADVCSDCRPDVTPCADPAGEILALLAGADERKGSVLIEAPGGTGKSALVREVVSRALDRFKNDPAPQPLPVLLNGGGDTVEQMIETAVASALPFPELLPAYLKAGDFFLVLDGVSESGLTRDVLAAFVNGPYGRATPLLLACRRGWVDGAVIRGSHWMTVELKPLHEESLCEFVTAYGGSTLPEPVKSACRGPDGGYLPSLVRMALVVNLRGDGPVSVADIYRAYFLKALEGQLSAEAERIRRLEEASRWCLETYWRDGLRRRRYEPTDPLQRQLRQAGLFVAADPGTEPKTVVFSDVSMQTFLTAHGLASQDRQGYQHLPRPTDDTRTASWDRSRVLLRAAAGGTFAAGAELFRMCLATFLPKKELRRWLCDELLRWAGRHDEDLPRRKVLAAVAGPIVDRVRGVRGSGKLLAEAARLSFDADEARDSIEALGPLYAGVAPLIYDLEWSESPHAPIDGMSIVRHDAIPEL